MNPLLVPLGSDLAKIARQAPAGAVLQLAAGDWEPQYLVGERPLTFQGSPDPTKPTRVRASKVHGWKFVGFPALTIADLWADDNALDGFQLVHCRNVEGQRLHFHRNGSNGFLTGDCFGVRLSSCEGSNHPNGHNVYYSEAGSDYILEDGDFDAAGHCNFQCNADPGHAQRLQVLHNRFGSAVNAAVQVAGVDGGGGQDGWGVFADNVVTGPVRCDFIFWNDTKAGYSCRNFDCTRQPGRYAVQPGCTGIQLPPGVKSIWPPA